MKTGRRILASVLVLMMLVTSLAIPAFAEETTEPAKSSNGLFSDIPEDAIYYTAVETLNLMGVINGYPDGTFQPLKNVTRAEFTAMLMRTLGYGSMGAATATGLPFSDVEDSNSDISWAIPNINTAYAMGIINGYEDGTFRPSANVAYEEAIKMIVCALGYTTLSTDVTPWYSQFVSQAKKLGILDVAEELGSAGTPASRACIAQMLYDSLEAEIVEQGNVTDKTILTDYLGYVKSIGVISSDGVTCLDEPDADLRDNEVQINGREPDGDYEVHTYTTTDPELKNYLGYEIEYYYKNDGKNIRTLALYVLQRNNNLELTADMIDEVLTTDNQIKYYKSENDKNASSAGLDADNVVIYNGKLYGINAANSRFDAANMIPLVGSMNLLDSDNDGKYDIIRIEDYEIYYVSNTVPIDYAIIDNVTKTGDAKRLVLDVYDNGIDTKIVDKNGKEREFSSISSGNIICLAESNSGNGGKPMRKAIVLNDNVTGTVTGIEPGRAMTVGGNRYEFSKAAPWMTGDDDLLAEPQLQESGTFCKDINGDIVAYKKNAVTENVMYGYIMGIAASDSAFDEEQSLRILSQSGSKIEAVLQKNVRIDGKSCSVAEAVELLEEAAQYGDQNNDPDRSGVSVHQTIKYTTRTSGGRTVIDKIYTAKSESKGMEVVTDKLYQYNKVTGAEFLTYNSTAKQLRSDDGNISVNISNAIVFVVPSERNNYDDYKKGSLSSNFRHGTKYQVEVFDVSPTFNTKVVVYYGGSAEVAVDSLTPVSVINYRENETNPQNGENRDHLMGYAASYSSPKGELDEWLSDDTEYVPQIGDIVRMGSDREGFATIKEGDKWENVLYRFGEDNTYGFLAGNENNFYTTACGILLGSVYAIDETSISILPERLGEKDVVDSAGGAMNFNISQFSGARVLQYDDKRDLEQMIIDVSDSYEGVLQGLTEYDEGLSNPSKVLIYAYEGKVRLLCVLGSQE